MIVSVIIPVFKAERFISEAIKSALEQPEVAEVVLVEDGSPDNSLRICRDLAHNYDKVKLFQHANGANRGEAASRNLAIQKAGCDIIALLDADDYYLPGRFSDTSKIMDADESIDGVYEAVGYHHQEGETEKPQNSDNLLTTMSRRVSPRVLFEFQAPVGNCGYCCTDGWTFRKRVFEKFGYFDEHLKLHTDTAMFVKLAATAKLLPGRLDEPVAMRRLHANNTITAPRSDEQKYYDRLLMWQALASWAPGKVSRRRQFLLLRKWLYCYMDGPSPPIKHPVWRKAFGVHRMLYFFWSRINPNIKPNYPICKTL